MGFARQSILLGMLAAVVTSTLATTLTVQAADICSDLVSGQFGKVWGCASSVLPSQKQHQYGPQSFGDNDNTTAWVEGAKNTGSGQWMELRFEYPQQVKTLYIVNGYAKDKQSFQNNGRIKQARISSHDGLNYTVTLKDTDESQPINLPRWVHTDKIRLTIESTYPGKKYTDTAVSEFMADLEEGNLMDIPD